MILVLIVWQLLPRARAGASLQTSQYVTPLPYNSIDSSYDPVPYNSYSFLPQHQTFSHESHVIKSLPPMFYGLPKFHPESFDQDYSEPYQPQSVTPDPSYHQVPPHQYFGQPSHHSPPQHSGTNQFLKRKAIQFEPYNPSPRFLPTPKPFIHPSSPKPQYHESYTPKPYYYDHSPKHYHPKPSPEPKSYFHTTPKPYQYEPQAYSPKPYNREPSPKPFYTGSSPSPYHGSPYKLDYSTPKPKIKFTPFVYHGPSDHHQRNLQISSQHHHDEMKTLFHDDASLPVTQRNLSPDPKYLSVTTPAPPHYGPYHRVTPTPSRAPRLLVTPDHNDDIVTNLSPLAPVTGPLKEEADPVNELDIIKLGSSQDTTGAGNYQQYPTLLHHVPPKPAISFIDPPSAPAPIAPEPLVLNPNILFRQRHTSSEQHNDIQRVTTTTLRPQTSAAPAGRPGRTMLLRQSKSSSKKSSQTRNSLIRAPVSSSSASARVKQQRLTGTKPANSDKSAALLNLMKIAGDDWDVSAAASGSSARTRGRHVSKFTCPEPEGHFPDPGDCSVYYQCAQNTPHRRQCDTGLLWSVETNQCDWEDNVTCQARL